MQPVQTYHKIMNEPLKNKFFKATFKATLLNELPDELKGIINSYVNPETDYYRTHIALLPLNRNGWKIGRNINTHDPFTDDNIKNIVQCMNEIPLLFKISKTYKVGS